MELGGQSDSQADMDVLESTADPVIAALETCSKRKICRIPMSFGVPAGFTQ